ncbi:MAG: adenylate/guanylate cyclase domain-containing protein [Xanthobacteraceae bacterium]
MTQLRDLVLRAPKRGLELPGWLERLVAIGTVTRDPKLLRRQRCVNVACFAVSVSAFSHLIFNALHDFRGLLIVNAYNLVMICGALLVPLLHRFGDNVAAITITMLVVGAHSCIVWSFGLASDLHVYFTLGGAVLFFFGVQNWRLFLLFFGLFVLALLTCLNFAPVDGLVIPQDHAFRDVLSNQAMVNCIAINAALLFYALAALDRTELDLENENDRSDALIHNVMPAAIAARLKSGREQRIADRIDTLSVLFADVVGFTSAVHDLAPDAVVQYLDHLVCLFDELAQQHGVEKIKTIGDNYMAAAGFDHQARAGAVAVGRLALGMREAIAHQLPLGGHKLRMRIGIHSGPATAGVIGSTRFSYDVWGDAVNFASRMESHGLPDKIQVSEAFRDLAGDAFVLEERGTTDLKGLAAARTFLLVAERLPGEALGAASSSQHLQSK